jgi:predicted DNA-binding protein with PD1-like motif
MKYKFDGYNWLVRLEKGEKLTNSLLPLIASQKIPSVWISAIGACSWAELGFYDLNTKQYIWQKLNQPMEIINLVGNLAWENNQPILHLHGTFSKQNLETVGGHIKELEVAGTCEVFLHRWYGDRLTRSEDSLTGLKLLDL